MREKIKLQSKNISDTKNNRTSCISNEKEVAEDPYSIDSLVNRNTSNLLVKSVDAMLANVDRIRYEAAQLGDDESDKYIKETGEGIPYYDDLKEVDSEEEFVQSHIVFDENGEAAEITKKQGIVFNLWFN